MSAVAGDPLRLEVRRVIRASPERLWAAWTTPAQLTAWWGPRGVRCVGAEVDARVGGRYYIDHAMPDGTTLRIAGEMVVVTPPVELVYTWTVTPGAGAARAAGAVDTAGAVGVAELVTVRFEPQGAATEVIVVHERIPDELLRTGHADGWNGCLDGLAAFTAAGD